MQEFAKLIKGMFASILNRCLPNFIHNDILIKINNLKISTVVLKRPAQIQRAFKQMGILDEKQRHLSYSG